MKKKEFIRKLRFNLLFATTAKQRAAVLSDYEEYFDVGLANGQTESELCARFGEPHIIVAELQNTDKTSHANIFSFLLIIAAIPFLLLNTIYYSSFFSILSVFYLCFIGTAAVLLCANSFGKTPCIVLSTVSATLSVVALVLNLWPILLTTTNIYFKIFSGMKDSQILVIINSFSGVIFFFTMLLWIFQILFSTRHTIKSLILLPLNTLSLFVFSSNLALCANYSGIGNVVSENFWRIVPLNLILAALPFAIAIFFIKRKELLWMHK